MDTRSMRDPWQEMRRLTVPLPPGLDLDRAKAHLKDGVLTVGFPKVDARPGMGRIPIKH